MNAMTSRDRVFSTVYSVGMLCRVGQVLVLTQKWESDTMTLLPVKLISLVSSIHLQATNQGGSRKAAPAAREEEHFRRAFWAIAAPVSDRSTSMLSVVFWNGIVQRQAVSKGHF